MKKALFGLILAVGSMAPSAAVADSPGWFNGMWSRGWCGIHGAQQANPIQYYLFC